MIATGLVAGTSPASGQNSQLAVPDEYRTDGELTGQQLYEAACANCHGLDGAGTDQNLVAFEEVVPDFSDCSFASREPLGDWVWVTLEGGPVRAFSEMMPAFGDALTEEEATRIIEHIRTFCGNDAWPRGGLNLPRPMFTEKAYPEDEAVWTTGVPLEGEGAVMNEIVFEKRFWARHQLEIVVPFGWQERTAEAGDGIPDGQPGSEWNGGIGDVALGWKTAVWHNFESGSILSLTGEFIFPTGSESKGFGKGTTVFEPFLSFGQLLPANGFFHFQGGFELPFDTDKAENEAFWRGVFGASLAQGGFGRTWSPMLEILGSRALESGATTHWDLVPQFQVTLNTRQHVMLNVAVRFPINDTAQRQTRLLVYLLWDWFDGGLFDGW
jgi:mono/diheme cytochrome c family protein